MAQAVENPQTFGNPSWADTIDISLGGEETQFHFDMQCPGQRPFERRHEIKRNGHDTSVKGCPQQYYCNMCGRNFYPHTSRFFHRLFGQLKQLLKRALKGGRINLQQLSAKFDLSESAASRLLAALVRKLHSLAESKRYKEFRRDGKVIFCDETFLTIQGEQLYIVAMRNEQGEVLDAFLTRHRSVDILLPHFRNAIKRMKRGVEVIVTDDFTTYQAVVRLLEVDITHVRCVHKPLFGRVIIDVVKWEGPVAHYTTAATTSDVLREGNTFLARVTKHDKKKSTPGGKRGRKEGPKNRPKEVIAAEKAEKAKLKEESPKKRGRKNNTKEGEVHVFHHDPKGGQVVPRYGSDPKVASALTQLLAYFAGKCITTNTEEEFFNTFKRLMHFSGWRTPEYWQELIDAYVILRQEKGAAGHLVDLLDFRPHMLRKNLHKLITAKISNSSARKKNHKNYV